MDNYGRNMSHIINGFYCYYIFLNVLCDEKQNSTFGQNIFFLIYFNLKIYLGLFSFFITPIQKYNKRK